MVKKKILVIIGTRPQYIKYSAIQNELESYFDIILLDTGQHYSEVLSSNFYNELSINKPRYHFSINSNNQLDKISIYIKNIGEVIEKEKPLAIICFGDTNTTLSCAIAANKNNIPLVHIESGERNFNRENKRVQTFTIPEESNRIIVDSISSLLLCSTNRAVKNLIEERNTGTIRYTGDITYDIYLKTLNSSNINENLVLSKYNLLKDSYYYCTIHRAINTDDIHRLSEIIKILSKLKDKVLLPIHPRTYNIINHNNLRTNMGENIIVINPVSYYESLIINKNSKMVITDSGGVIREAYFNGIISIIIDNTTEWIDIVDSKWSYLCGIDENLINEAINSVYRPVEKINLFGDGNSRLRVIEELLKWMY